MKSLMWFRVLLGAALAITSVQASPFGAMDVRDFGLSPRDTDAHQCSDLVVGATRSPDIGTVCVDLANGTLTITYHITTAGWTFNAVHAWVGTSPPTSTTPGTAPGKFPYTTENGKCVMSADNTTATCTVSPIPDTWRSCTGTLYIVAHADVTGPGGIQQTAWDNGICYPDNKGNCAKYFTVSEMCDCPLIVSFYPITSMVCERPKAKFSRHRAVGLMNLIDYYHPYTYGNFHQLVFDIHDSM